MRKWMAIVLMGMLVGSCQFHEPEFRGEETFKLNNIEGQKVHFTAGGKVYNENWFAIKVKPSELDLYADGKYMGKIFLENKLKMKGKTETTLDALMRMELENGAMFKAIGLMNKDEVTVRLTGKVKAGVFFLSKKLDVNETKKVKPSSFKR